MKVRASDNSPDSHPPSVTFSLLDSWTLSLGMERGEPIERISSPDRDAAKSKQLLDSIRALATKQGATIQCNSIKSNGRGPAGYWGPEFQRTIVDTVILAFGAAGGASAFFLLGKDLILKWLGNRGTRSIRLKAGNNEVEIVGSNNIEEALNLLSRLVDIEASDASASSKSNDAEV